MNEGHEYFANQEEEISNKFMSANGTKESPTKMSNPTQNSLLSWKCSACDGLDVECQLVCKGKKLLIWGVIAYVGYRVLIKKK